MFLDIYAYLCSLIGLNFIFFIRLSTYLPITFLLSIYLSNHRSGFNSIVLRIHHLPIYLFIYLFKYLYICSSIHHSIYLLFFCNWDTLHTFHLFIYLSINIIVLLSIYPSFHNSVFKSIVLRIHLFLSSCSFIYKYL